MEYVSHITNLIIYSPAMIEHIYKIEAATDLNRAQSNRAVRLHRLGEQMKRDANKYVKA